MPGPSCAHYTPIKPKKWIGRRPGTGRAPWLGGLRSLDKVWLWTDFSSYSHATTLISGDFDPRGSRSSSSRYHPRACAYPSKGVGGVGVGRARNLRTARSRSCKEFHVAPQNSLGCAHHDCRRCVSLNPSQIIVRFQADSNGRLRPRICPRAVSRRRWRTHSRTRAMRS